MGCIVYFGWPEHVGRKYWKDPIHELESQGKMRLNDQRISALVGTDRLDRRVVASLLGKEQRNEMVNLGKQERPHSLAVKS
jgi:hypothetical protein